MRGDSLWERAAFGLAVYEREDWRFVRLSWYGPFYRRLVTSAPSRCVYCGGPRAAFQDDHVPPLVRLDGWSDDRIRSARLLLVPCCGRCNRLAGAHAPDELEGRIRWVRNRLAVLGVAVVSPGRLRRVNPDAPGAL